MAAMDIAGDEGDLESLKYVILTLCIWGIFHDFYCLLIFFQNLVKIYRD